MKNLIQISLFCLLLTSCGDDEISYPATYDFDRNEEIGTSIVTKNLNGVIIEVDAIQSFNVSLCEVFETIQGSQGLNSVTLISESELELIIIDGSGMSNTIQVPYAVQGNLILEELGLEFDENDNIVVKICNEYTFTNIGLSLAESNTCSIDDPLEATKARFTNNNFSFGDTLGLCLIKKIYKAN